MLTAGYSRVYQYGYFDDGATAIKGLHSAGDDKPLQDFVDYYRTIYNVGSLKDGKLALLRGGEYSSQGGTLSIFTPQINYSGVDANKFKYLKNIDIKNYLSNEATSMKTDGDSRILLTSRPSYQTIDGANSWTQGNYDVHYRIYGTQSKTSDDYFLLPDYQHRQYGIQQNGGRGVILDCKKGNACKVVKYNLPSNFWNTDTYQSQFYSFVPTFFNVTPDGQYLVVAFYSWYYGTSPTITRRAIMTFKISDIINASNNSIISPTYTRNFDTGFKDEFSPLYVDNNYIYSMNHRAYNSSTSKYEIIRYHLTNSTKKYLIIPQVAVNSLTCDDESMCYILTENYDSTLKLYYLYYAINPNTNSFKALSNGLYYTDSYQPRKLPLSFHGRVSDPLMTIVPLMSAKEK